MKKEIRKIIIKNFGTIGKGTVGKVWEDGAVEDLVKLFEKLIKDKKV